MTKQSKKIWPSRKQFWAWSIPAKASFIGIPLALILAITGWLMDSEKTINQTGETNVNIEENTGIVNIGIKKEDYKELAIYCGMLQKDYELSERAVINFLGIIGEKECPRYLWFSKLEELAKGHKELLEKVKQLDSDDPEVKALKVQAQNAVKDAEYEKAEIFLKNAQEIDMITIQTQQEQLDKRKISAAETLAMRASLAMNRLEYTNAIYLCQEALRVLPENEQRRRGTYTNNLAFVYHKLGKYELAEEFIKKALEIDEAVFGRKHPNFARDMNNLASLYLITNRLKEAESLIKEALEIDEDALGKTHPNVARDLTNLAGIYLHTNRLTDAKPLIERTLKIDRMVFGSEHRNFARDLNNIGAIYRELGQTEEAESILKQALEIIEMKCGKEYPEVAIALSNLGSLYQLKNRFTEAEPLLKRALEINKKVFGEGHPDYAYTLNGLAALYIETKRYEEAEPLMLQTLQINEKVFGGNHPEIADTLLGLALIYDETGRLVEAELLTKRCLEIFIEFYRQTGYLHQEMQPTINYYDDLLVKMGYNKGEAVIRLKQLWPEMTVEQIGHSNKDF